MEKNSQEKATQKLGEVEAGWYVISTSCSRLQKPFIGKVVATYFDFDNPRNSTSYPAVIVESNSIELEDWSTRIGNGKAVSNSYIIRKATDLEVALC